MLCDSFDASPHQHQPQISSVQDSPNPPTLQDPVTSTWSISLRPDTNETDAACHEGLPNIEADGELSWTYEDYVAEETHSLSEMSATDSEEPHNITDRIPISNTSPDLSAKASVAKDMAASLSGTSDRDLFTPVNVEEDSLQLIHGFQAQSGSVLQHSVHFGSQQKGFTGAGDEIGQEAPSKRTLNEFWDLHTQTQERVREFVGLCKTSAEDTSPVDLHSSIGAAMVVLGGPTEFWDPLRLPVEDEPFAQLASFKLLTEALIQSAKCQRKAEDVLKSSKTLPQDEHARRARVYKGDLAFTIAMLIGLLILYLVVTIGG